MKRISIYLLTLMAFVSCAVEDNEFLLQGDTAVTLPEPQFYEDPTRSSLTFDATQKIMLFAWDSGDELGVFWKCPANDENYSPSDIQQFIYKQKATQNGAVSSLTRKFEPKDEALAITANQTYYAYMPLDVKKTHGYEDIPVSYFDQETADVVKFYYQRSSGTEEQKTTYQNSEKTAASHLGKYDYLVSTASSSPENNISFNMNRLGAVIRFFFEVPVNGEVVDSIHMYSKNKKFLIDGKLDLSTQTMTAKSESNVMSLRFNRDEHGVIQGVPTAFTRNPGLYKTQEVSSKAYIITYMMVAPIDFTVGDQECYLYMFAHTDDSNKTFKVYRSNGALNRYNFEANKVYQLTIQNPTYDDFITFIPLTVQQWKEETGITNDGKDTGSW